MYETEVDFSELVGKTILSVEKMPGFGSEIIYFVTDDGKYKMFHNQDCCEAVELVDICGELEWLTCGPVLSAEVVTSSEIPPMDDFNHGDYQWTFYKISTNRGTVTFRWYGTSNGFYSVEVYFVKAENWEL